MLTWVVVFLIIALVSGLLGFYGVSGMSMQIAKVLFFIFIVLFLVSLVYMYVYHAPSPLPTPSAQ